MDCCGRSQPCLVGCSRWWVEKVTSCGAGCFVWLRLVLLSWLIGRQGAWSAMVRVDDRLYWLAGCRVNGRPTSSHSSNFRYKRPKHIHVSYGQ